MTSGAGTSVTRLREVAEGNIVHIEILGPKAKKTYSMAFFKERKNYNNTFLEYINSNSISSNFKNYNGTDQRNLIINPRSLLKVR